MNDSPIIDPKNLPLWTATGFIVALLALVLAFVSMYRLNTTIVATQTEVLMLNKKIEALSKDQTSAPAAAAASSAK